MSANADSAPPSVARPRPAVGGSRQYYMDWLRVVIIGMVFVAHVMMPFSGAPWLITADQKFPLGGGIAAIGNQFAMPVMFFLAGAGAYFSLRRRSPSRYARERLLRLGLPFVLFTVLLSPVQAYYAALDAGTYSGPFFPDFLPHFFNLDGFTAFDLSWIGHSPGPDRADCVACGSGVPDRAMEPTADNFGHVEAVASVEATDRRLGRSGMTRASLIASARCSTFWICRRVSSARFLHLQGFSLQQT